MVLSNINIKKVKIIVTVPVGNASEVRLALGDAGAGIIGNYAYCSINSEVKGTFKGNNLSNPTIGAKNELETVSEIKIEVQCDVGNVKSILNRLREVHPYEEPAIDIVPLLEEDDL
jgi:hypothetical protein